MQHLLTEIGVWLLGQVVLNEEAKPVSQDWGKVAGASGGERCNTS